MSRNASGPSSALVRLANGQQVHYVEQGPSDGEVVVFLHGYTDSSFSFSTLLPALPERYHAFAYDQRGHGDSERPQCCYTAEDFTDDAVSFLDAVGAERATVVGHSAGSFVARRVAQRHPERVSKLVLLASGPTADKEEVRQFQAAVHTLEDPVPPDFARDFQSSTTFASLPAVFWEQVVAESLKLPARVWRDALDGLVAFDDAADLRRMSAPTLVLWGEEDQWFTREEQDALTAAIPDARLVVYPRTGHAPHWERPERVAADLDAFIAGS